MEALTSLGISWQALVSQVVNFLILLTLLRLFLYRPIIDLLESRRAKIKKGLEDAKQSQLELENAEGKSKEIISQANRKAQKIIETAQKQSRDETQKAVEQAKQSSHKIVEAAKSQAELEKAKAVSGAKAEIGAMVVMATEKIVAQKSDIDSIDKILSSINENE